MRNFCEIRSPVLNRADDVGSMISVILLTYNHLDLISSTLKSIQEQSISGFEIIVSDDCSSDGTWQRILAIAAVDSRIKAIQTPKNIGMAGNANFAVLQTVRPYIALLHHDDIYRYDMLERWVAVLERHPNAAFVFNPYGVYRSDYVYRKLMPGECIDGHWLLETYLLPDWGCAVRGTAMIRRSAWESVGGIREEFGLLADVDLWMRLAMRWPVGYVNEPVIAIRQQRPEDYPDEYKEGRWSWRRQRILYEIHAANRLAYWRLNTLGGRLKWWGFRLKLNLETAKWLIYAVVRKKPEMIITSDDCVTTYDLQPLRLLRWVLKKTYAA